jgi:hypothetical protein
LWTAAVATHLGFIFLDNTASSYGHYGISATTYGWPEDIGVAAIVIPKLEFGNIERQIFAPHLVISPDNPSLDGATRSPQSCWCTAPTTCPNGVKPRPSRRGVTRDRVGPRAG